MLFSVYLTVLEDKSDEEQFIDVLNITAAGKNGIKSGTENEGRAASLTIRELTLNIDAPVNDAINAEQTLEVEGGTPPEKPAGSPSGTPPEMPAQNNATSQAEIAAG